MPHAAPSRPPAGGSGRVAGFAALLAAAVLGASPATARCDGEIGRAQAAELVRRCLDVSPATRPPCNAANACALIEDEIARGCRILAGDAPDWCRGSAR